MRRVIDWFSDIKMNVLVLSCLLQMMRVKVIQILVQNAWLLENDELASNFFKLCQIVEDSTIDLDVFVECIELIECTSILFDVEDLKDEVALIQDNIYLEMEFVSNMTSHMRLLDDRMASFGAIEQSSIKFTEQGYDFFLQMEENAQMLKQLRQERRENYIE